MVGVIWNDAIKRVIRNGELEECPIEMLALVPYYRGWGWSFQMTSEWAQLYTELKARAETLPLDSTLHINIAISLAFIDGVFNSMESAVSQTVGYFSDVLPSRQLHKTLVNFGIVLGNCGWETCVEEIWLN